MSTEGNLEKHSEQEPAPAKEIWIIDDDKETIEGILRFWQMKTQDIGYGFKHFETGQSALEEIKRRKESKEKLPDLVFVDGELEKDQEELRKGANLIKEIRSIEEIEQPKIIAHSSDFVNNVELLMAGADLGFQKKDITKSAEFLKDPEHYKHYSKKPERISF
ncbi:hypothetical protein KKD19_06180 [Patescibacteria group bacterium]|nr:hypothetical protein [Patescibacteria group bacterium]MBU4512792.1 hypothetical protein [Patescibacteria group bacterium]